MLINGAGDIIGEEGDIGWAPLLALAAPVAKAAAVTVGTKVLGKVASSLKGKPKPPPCTFGQKVSRFFGGKPNCT